MCCLIFILLVLIPSNTMSDCVSKITLTGEQKICSGQNFTLSCQFNCQGSSNLVQLLKDGHSEKILQSSEHTITIPLQVNWANKSHSGRYSCQNNPQRLNIIDVTVYDCSVSTEYISTVHTTYSPINTIYQAPTQSRILEPVLIWYILFKTGVYLIGSITAALTTVYQRL